MEGITYVDTERVIIREINKSTAKDIIVKYHYTHSWTSCRYSLGIFYRGDEPDAFGNSEQLIGCLIYGFPIGRSAVQSISETLSNDEVLELTRLYIHDGYGKNIESYCIGQSFKWIREHAPKVKVLLSYADPDHRHLGGIYQATNWLYQKDIKLVDSYELSLVDEPYDWIHSRSVVGRWGSCKIDNLKVDLGNEGYTEFWWKKISNKHRYIQILTTNRKQRKELLKNLKHPISDYPKYLEDDTENIQHYTTIIPETKGGFW